jgi:hypothetical protein
MSDRSSKRPRDPNEQEYRINLESTGQVPKYEPKEQPKTPLRCGPWLAGWPEGWRSEGREIGIAQAVADRGEGG